MSVIEQSRQSHSPTSAVGRTDRRPPRWRRALRGSAILAAALVAVTLTSTLTNAAITGSEKSTLVPYGQKVTIDAGDVNVVRNGGTGPTMVLLSGYGTAAPAVDFAPLIRELDEFDVIVVEGFGYGYSDLDVPDRSIENITEEIHDVLDHLDVESPVILVGHSIGGLYTHHYANAYPGEVSAIVGIDPTPATTSSQEVGDPSKVQGALTTTGLVRWANALVPELVQPSGTAFTTEERERIVAMTNWNFGNDSLADEWAQLGANSTKAAAQPLPSTVPVLEFLSTESVESIPGWLEHHEEELAGVTTHELDVIDGAHYLHWTQSGLMARTISDFVTAHVTG